MKASIHPTAEGQTERVGEGTHIWQYCVVLKGARIGKNCNLNAHCFVEDNVVIGNNVTLKRGVYLWNGIRIEDDVFVGPNATFVNDVTPRSKQYPTQWARTWIRRGASIGAGATLLPVTVGEYAMIGAGSVVTKEVPAHTLWFGHPAEFKGYVCRCGTRLPETLVCPRCGRSYARADDGSLRLRE